jgi:Domain of unknown function DUF29
MVLSSSNVAYAKDFNLWIENTIGLLKAKDFAALDIENLIDELESMSKRDKREILSRLDVILMHLLKWQYQPSKRSASWESSIQNNRKEIWRVIEDSPSLGDYPSCVLEKAYQSARKDAARETRLPLETFPIHCPFTSEEALDEAFWPESIS